VEPSEEKKFDWREFVFRNQLIIGLATIGLILTSCGLYYLFQASNQETSVEIIPVEEEKKATSLWVDIEGAVEHPGVYELSADSRVNDLLIMAGGLSAAADREWLEKYVNLAQKLSDGMKVYILQKGELQQQEASVQFGSVAGNADTIINLNTASASELDGLWGIGEKRAQDIIKNRPFSSIEELKNKKIVPSNVYERIKEQISI